MRKPFTQHTLDSAPQASRVILEYVRGKYEMIPNIAAMMAESPLLLKLYVQGSSMIEREGSFTPAELAIIHLAISAENKCNYCVAAHSSVASSTSLGQMNIAALRQGNSLPDMKLEALRKYVIKVNKTKGLITSEDLKLFIESGYTKSQALEVVAVIALKAITNYTNHIVETELDDQFKSNQWNSTTAGTDS